MSKTIKAVPEGYHTLTPILVFEESKKAVAWYKDALGATEIGVSTDPSGRVMHGEIRIGDSKVMLHDVMGQEKGPKAYGGSPANLWIYTENPDALFDRAVKAGAKVGMPMTDMFWGDRFGYLTDPFGYGWAIAARREEPTKEEIETRAKAAFATQNC